MNLAVRIRESVHEVLRERSAKTNRSYQDTIEIAILNLAGANAANERMTAGNKQVVPIISSPIPGFTPPILCITIDGVTLTDKEHDLVVQLVRVLRQRKKPRAREAVTANIEYFYESIDDNRPLHDAVRGAAPAGNTEAGSPPQIDEKHPANDGGIPSRKSRNRKPA